MKKIIKLIQRYKFNKERKIIISCIKNNTTLPIKLQHKILKASLKYLYDYTECEYVAIKNVIETYDIFIKTYDYYYDLFKLIPAFAIENFIKFCNDNNYEPCLIKQPGNYYGYTKESKIEFIKYLIKTYE